MVLWRENTTTTEHEHYQDRKGKMNRLRPDGSVVEAAYRLWGTCFLVLRLFARYPLPPSVIQASSRRKPNQQHRARGGSSARWRACLEYPCRVYLREHDRCIRKKTCIVRRAAVQVDKTTYYG